MNITITPETYYNTAEAEELTLDSNHPGVADSDYINRRAMFFNVAREHRLHDKGLPYIEYTSEEHDIWRTVSEKLIESHNKSASEIYLEGKNLLGIETHCIPQLKDLDKSLREQHDMGLVPAEGLIDVKNFFHYLSQRFMPCTQFLRHGANPEYTPEPDAVHDVIGHIPPLMNKEYADLIQLIGQGVHSANMEQLQAWQRIYWFTVEFGLIEESNQLKVYGAGLLSSFGEMEYCFSEKVDRRPFDLDKVIHQAYNSNIMQNVLYVIPSLSFLREQIEILIERFTKSEA
jgi:monomeric phenylalanine-4-hydroxylase